MLVPCKKIIFNERKHFGDIKIWSTVHDLYILSYDENGLCHIAARGWISRRTVQSNITQLNWRIKSTKIKSAVPQQSDSL